MLGRLSLIALLPVFMLATPASALTAKQKMETCKFGAEDQKLTGAKRDAFIKRCMSNKNDKRGPAPKSAGAKPPAAPQPAATDESEPAEQK